MCPLLAPVWIGFYAAAINSTNKANKAGSMCREAVYIYKMSMDFDDFLDFWHWDRFNPSQFILLGP
jgi:hypothetical protein